MAEQPSSVREPAAAAPVAPPKAIGAPVPEGIAFGEHRMHNRTKTVTVARKVRIRSRNRINHCPEPAGNGHFVPRNGPKTPESAPFLPETGRFPYAFAALRRAPTRRPARPQRPFALSPSSPVTLARHPGVHRFCPISAGVPPPPKPGAFQRTPHYWGAGGLLGAGGPLPPAGPKRRVRLPAPHLLDRDPRMGYAGGHNSISVQRFPGGVPSVAVVRSLRRATHGH